MLRTWLIALALGAGGFAGTASARDIDDGCLSEAFSKYRSEVERPLALQFGGASILEVELLEEDADALFGEQQPPETSKALKGLEALFPKFTTPRRVQFNDLTVLVAGFDDTISGPGVLLVRTELGARVFDFNADSLKDALVYAGLIMRACPPRRSASK